MEQAPWSNSFNVRTGASQAAANEIADMQYADQLRARNQALAAAKAAAFANDVEFQNGSNPFDETRIREENTELVRKLGEFTTKHPNWNVDPYLSLQFKQLKKSQLSTPAVLRSIAYKEAEKRMNEDLADVAKNPHRYNIKAYEDLVRQRDNYRKYGHQLGEAAAKEEGPQVFTYKRPQDFIDDEKVTMDAGSKFKSFDNVPVNNGRIGAYKQVPKESDLKNIAESFYKNNKAQFDQKYTENGIDPITGITNQIRPYIGGETFQGYENEFELFKRKADYEARLKSAMSAPSSDPYKQVIVDSNNISPSDEKAISTTFGSTPTIKYKGPDGKDIVESGNRFYWTGLRDKNYTSDAKGNPKSYVKDGIKVGDGYIFKPISWGEENGILEDTKLWGTKLEVKPELADSYEIFTPPPGVDGVSTPILKVRAMTEVNANSPDYARKYNAYIHSTTKQREGVGEGNMLSQDVYTDDNGNLFIYDALGKAIPYQK